MGCGGMAAAGADLPGAVMGSLLLVAAVVVAGLLLARQVSPGLAHASARPAVASAQERPIDILKERYARGEIGHEEFERRLDTLLDHPGS